MTLGIVGIISTNLNNSFHICLTLSLAPCKSAFFLECNLRKQPIYRFILLFYSLNKFALRLQIYLSRYLKVLGRKLSECARQQKVFFLGLKVLAQIDELGAILDGGRDSINNRLVDHVLKHIEGLQIFHSNLRFLLNES